MLNVFHARKLLKSCCSGLGLIVKRDPTKTWMLISLRVLRALRKARFELVIKNGRHNIIYMQLLCLGRKNIDVADAKTGVWLLVLDGFPVTLSPLLFEDVLHWSPCVLDDSCLNLDP